MYNIPDLDYFTGDILIKRNDEWCEVSAIGTHDYVRDAIDDIDVLRSRVEHLEEIIYQTQEDLRRTQIDRILIAETNGSRLYIEGHNVDKLPADLEDVTLRELLEIISI